MLIRLLSAHAHVIMADAGFLEVTAPFLVNYWPYLLGGALTLILAVLVA